jgi:hypothetical protein
VRRSRHRYAAEHEAGAFTSHISVAAGLRFVKFWPTLETQTAWPPDSWPVGKPVRALERLPTFAWRVDSFSGLFVPERKGNQF